MKKATIDQKLVDSRPAHISGKQIFVSKTMKVIKKTTTGRSFADDIHIQSANIKELLRMKLGILFSKFSRLPRYAAALVIIGSMSTVGAATYVTYRWVNPSVTITSVIPNNDDNKRQYTIDGQCGDLASGKALKYELSRSSGLSDTDALKVFKNTCAYDALGTFINSKWISDNDPGKFPKKKVGDIVTIYDYLNIFAGSTKSNPIFGLTIGKVTNISTHEISISLPLYAVDNSASGGSNPVDYYPQGKLFSRTLALSPHTEVFEIGNKLSLSDINVGDEVQLITRTQNYVKYYQDIHQNSLGAQITFDVAGIIKTDIDTRYVAGSGSAIGDPAIINALAQLEPCESNTNYSCVLVPNQVLGQVYAVDGNGGKNLHYQRADAIDNKKVKSYRLDGRITSVIGDNVTLVTRGKKTNFRVSLPNGAVSEYNTSKPLATEYSKSMDLKVGVGDLVEVLYVQAPNEDHLKIKTGDLQVFSVIEQSQPDGSIVKY